MFKKIIFLCLVAISFVSCIDIQETFMLENARIKIVGDDIGLTYYIEGVLIADELTDIKRDKVNYIEENLNNISLVVNIRAYNTDSSKVVYLTYFVDGIEVEKNRGVISWETALKLINHQQNVIEQHEKNKAPKVDTPIPIKEPKPTKFEKL